MLWSFLAAALYVIVGLGFYFFGFRAFKKLHEFSSRLGGSSQRNRESGSASIFEEPRSRPLMIFFKSLGIFLMLAGVVFFLAMLHLAASRR